MKVQISKLEMAILTHLQYNWGVWAELGFVNEPIESVDISSGGFWSMDWLRSPVRFEVTVNGIWKAEINLRRENISWVPVSASPLNFPGRSPRPIRQTG